MRQYVENMGPIAMHIHGAHTQTHTAKCTSSYNDLCVAITNHLGVACSSACRICYPDRWGLVLLPQIKGLHFELTIMKSPLDLLYCCLEPSSPDSIKIIQFDCCGHDFCSMTLEKIE